MSIFSSASRAICNTFDMVGDVAASGQEVIEIGTRYVHNRAAEQRHTDQDTVKLRTAQVLNGIREELHADPNLAAIYAEFEEDW